MRGGEHAERIFFRGWLWRKKNDTYYETKKKKILVLGNIALPRRRANLTLFSINQ